MGIFLDNQQVKDLLSVDECITVLSNVFTGLSTGKASNKPRIRLRLPAGFLHFMSAASLEFGGFGYKAYTTFPSGVQSFIHLYDSETGHLLAILEAAELGKIRTGAATGLATKYLAPRDTSVLGIIGTGSQAQTQLQAICAVRSISSIRAYSRNPDNLDRFAVEMERLIGCEVIPMPSAEMCVQGAQVVVTATSSRDPVLKREWLEERVHINAVGSNHWMRRELDSATIRASIFTVVDDIENAKLECGDLIWPIERGLLTWENIINLSELITGKVSAPNDLKGITLFESQGLAIEDIAASMVIYQKAIARNIGSSLPF